MKKKFAEIYGVRIDQFKFIFDGSVLQDNETPEDVEMEDSNIIDVKVSISSVCSMHSITFFRWINRCTLKL